MARKFNILIAVTIVATFISSFWSEAYAKSPDKI